MPDNEDFLNLDDKNKDGELLLGKFKTPEELAKAYTELEGEFTRRSTENAELKRINEQRQQMPVIQQQPTQDDEINFFENPAAAIEKVVGKMVSPLIEAGYHQQKESYRTGNPDFAKYEAEIDQIITQMPHLKTQPNIVGQLFKMVKGLHYDEKAEETRLTAKIKAELAGKQEGALEGGGASDLAKPRDGEITLSAEEQRVARKFNPGLPAKEAYKRYHDLKVKHGGRV